jgi:putative flippase GtrA
MRHEFLRFLLTGSANTAASWLVYLVFNLFLPYTAAYTIAYGFGMVFTYYMNTRWVFKVPMKWSTFMQFPVIFALRYCMDVSVLFVLVNYVGCPEAFAPLATVVLTMPIGFLLSRLVLMRRAHNQEEHKSEKHQI